MVAGDVVARSTVRPVRRVVCSEYGPPASLQVVEEPDPTAGPGRVVVAVEAAGVNYADALTVAGTYQIKIPLPFTPGMEMAGTIVALGDGVEGFGVGDRVLGMTFGAYASHVVVPATALTRVPDNLELHRAAGLVQSYCTMWFALTRRMTVEPGQTVLVLGAGGGIGLASVDVATALGARVIAAASSAEKLDLARAAGATELINYTTEDLKVRAKELSGGGVDVVVDPVGGPLAEPALRATGWNGRFLVIGFAGGGIPKLPANLVLLNNRTLVGVDWGAWTGRDPAGQHALLDEILAAVAAGRLHPPEPHRESLDDAGAVLQALLDRQLVGKTVLVP
jgi:NADPH2:quinone reductase